jgi:hypothetical protein
MGGGVVIVGSLAQGKRFKRFSSPEAQSFRLQSQPKAAKAALNHETHYQVQGLSLFQRLFLQF